MERARFVELSSDTLVRLEGALADLEHESLDVELAGDVLTLDFGDGSPFVINAHSAAGQIWMAANRNAWHFDYRAETGTWIAAKTGDELTATVAREVSSKLGIQVSLP